MFIYPLTHKYIMLKYHFVFFKVILNKELAYPLSEYNKNRFSNVHTAALQVDERQEF